MFITYVWNCIFKSLVYTYLHPKIGTYVIVVCFVWITTLKHLIQHAYLIFTWLTALTGIRQKETVIPLTLPISFYCAYLILYASKAGSNQVANVSFTYQYIYSSLCVYFLDYYIFYILNLGKCMLGYTILPCGTQIWWNGNYCDKASNN